MLSIILGILILIILLHYLPQPVKEGFTEYNEISCQTLAKQNQDNIVSLQADVKKLLDLDTKVNACEGQLESNKQQLKLIADQMAKMPN